MDLARERGILFGSALSHGPRGGIADPRLRAVMTRECAVIVPENEMKIYVLGHDPARLDFGRADALARFACENGQRLRGHTLLWNRSEYIPKDLAFAGDGPGRRPAVERWLTAYIAAVCGHFGGQVHSWDVVNETIDPDTGGLRDTLFTRALGFDGLGLAFEAAKAHAPHAQRVYNDYMSWGADNAKHRAGVLRLLERFRAAGVPVDAVGLQSHIGNTHAINTTEHRAWRDFVEAIVAMGYGLLITEFDVNDRGLPRDPARRDAEVAAIAKDYLDQMLSYRQLGQFLCWGMVDRYSWLQGFTPRDDHQPQRPLPYDADFRPKPLRAAIAAALAAAPRR